MKRLFVLFVLPLVLIANTASGEPDLQGCWSVEVNCIGPAPPLPNETFFISIENQSEGLFEVYNCSDSDADPCYGAIDKRNIYITCWDNIITGQIEKNGTKMTFITQNQDPVLKEAGTCKGTAEKVDAGNCTGPGCSASP